MNNLVSCELMGGLGNQLFQIFATLAYGINHKLRIIFPYSETLDIGMSRPTYWNTFLDRLKGFTTFVNYSNITNHHLSSLPIQGEVGFHFNKIPTLDNIKLYGYFQSYKYFEDFKNDIFKLIGIEEKKSDVLAEYKNKYFSIDSLTYISMHFRLGDYKQKQRYHPVLPLSYYSNSLRLLSKTIDIQSICRVLYFCEEEDNDTVSQVIAILSEEFPGIEFVKVDDTTTDWKQMLLMSLCNHNIIANSSFSWWGAYFNSNPNNIVCYPNVWFGEALRATHNTSDMYPNSWIRVEI